MNKEYILDLIDYIEVELWWLKEYFISDPYREIKYAYQRVVRGFDDTDIWSLYGNHSERMVSMLDMFIENHTGYPFSLTEKKWINILKQMRDGFQADIDKAEIEFKTYKQHKRELDKLEKKRIKGMELFVKYYNNLWD